MIGRLTTSPIALVARREIVERLRSRALRAGTAFTVLVVVAGIVIPTLRDSGPRRYDVFVMEKAPPALVDALERAGEIVQAEVTAHTVETADDVRRAVREEEADLGVTVESGEPELVVRRGFSAGEPSRLARLVTTASQIARLQLVLERAGIRADAIDAVNAAPTVELRALEQPAADPARRFAAFYGVMLLFILLVQYGGWVLNGVIEEKSSRVAEVLLCTLRPRQLLAGKVLGIGLLALVHGLLLVAVALGSAAAVGSTVVFESLTVGAVAWMGVWFLLGYALYCNLYAVAGALVTRLEDAQTMPIMAPVMLGYFTASSVIGSGDVSPFVRVLALVPLTAPFDMPVLIALGEAETWEIALSVTLVVLTSLALARLAGAIYARSVLHVGRRLQWREALRSPVAGGA